MKSDSCCRRHLKEDGHWDSTHSLLAKSHVNTNKGQQTAPGRRELISLAQYFLFSKLVIPFLNPRNCCWGRQDRASKHATEGYVEFLDAAQDSVSFLRHAHRSSSWWRGGPRMGLWVLKSLQSIGRIVDTCTTPQKSTLQSVTKIFRMSVALWHMPQHLGGIDRQISVNSRPA